MTYAKLTIKELNQNIKTFLNIVGEVCIQRNIKRYENITYDRILLAKVETRVHQRRSYYHFFHNISMNQIKEAALRAYWIIKYKPFKKQCLLNKDDIIESYDINTYIAFWVLLYTLGEYAKEKIKEKCGCELKTINIPNELVKKTIRTLNECDASKESIIEISNTWFLLLIHRNNKLD